MKRLRFLRPASILYLISIAGLTYAQQRDSIPKHYQQQRPTPEELLSKRTGEVTVTYLGEATVTSSLIPTSPTRTGRNIVTIKGDQFAKLPVNSVDELLRYVPGVEVQSRGPMGSQSDFIIRGGTFQQVLVIVDGNRVNDPNSGHFTSYIPITPAQIERIEVLKGASSAIYGSDAVGGVINIITKSFAGAQKRNRDFSAQITGGQYGLFNANAGGSYSNGKTSVDGGILSNNASGQPQRGTDGFFHNNTISAGIQHALSSTWQLGLRSSFDSRDFAAQNFYTTFLSDTAKEKVTTSWNQLRLIHTGAKATLSVLSAYKNVHDIYQYSSISSANKSTSELFQTLVTYDRRISENTSIVSGVQFQNRSIDSNDRGHHVIKQGAAFVIVQQFIGSSFTMSPALRLDYDERGGTELVPQLNASHATGNFQFRGSIGRTIRQADFTERYNNYNKTLVTSGRIGNPNLSAEKSISYELGVDYWLVKTRLKISASLFQQNFNKLIDYKTTPYASMPRKDNLSPTGTYALALNVSDVTTSGSELDLIYRESVSEKHAVFASAGLLWLKSTTPGGTPSLYLSSHAKFLTNFTAGFATSRYALSLTGVYKVRALQEATGMAVGISADYFIINAKAEYFIVKNKMSAFVQMDNIGDTRYSDVLGAVMPHRWTMGGVKLTIR